MSKKVPEFFIKCKDHTVTNESFKLFHDKEYDMLATFPKPAKENLANYYESENYISHTDARRSIFEKIYHIVKKYALNKKVKLISGLNVNGKRLLDVGAGTGDFLAIAKKSKWYAEGVEPNEQARSLAEKKGIALTDSTRGFNSHNFDVITMWHVLEHVSDVKEQIREIKRLLSPNGYVIIAVPNFKSYDAAHYGAYWAAYDVPRHLWHFSKHSIQKLFEEEQMTLEKMLPMKFDSYYVSLLSEKYKYGKMNYIRAFTIGFISNWRAKRTEQYSSHIYIIKNSIQ